MISHTGNGRVFDHVNNDDFSNLYFLKHGFRKLLICLESTIIII